MGLLPHHGFLSSDGFLTVTYGNAPGPNGMSGGAVWQLNTATGIWKDISPSKGSFGYAGLAVDPRHPGTIMVSTMDRWSPGDTVYRTTDGGAHWEDIAPASERDWSLTPYMTFGGKQAGFGWWIGALALDPFHPDHAIYGTGATIWESKDVTKTDVGQPTHWAIGAKGLEETAVIDLISPTGGPHLVSGLGDIGGYVHDDISVSPKTGMWKPAMYNCDSIDFAERKPSVIARVGRGGPGAYSIDSGATWKAFATDPAAKAESGTVAVSADGATILWAPNGSDPAVTRDMGATWQPCTGFAGGKISVVSDRVRPLVFYASDASTVYVSTDGGLTFAARSALPPGARQLRSVPGHTGELWITAQNKGLYHSTDGGSTFAPAGAVTDAQRLGFGKSAPGHDYPALYLTGQTEDGQSGVFRSDDVGVTWLRINDFAHEFGYSGEVVTGDPRIYGRVYMGSNGRGILYADPSPAPKNPH
jgi:photosystem II stability/assembly factor-like uncharacterized protein